MDWGDEGKRPLSAAGLWSGGDGSAGVPVSDDEAGRTGSCGGGCGSWRRNAGVSGIDGCTSYWRGKAWW